MAVEFAQVGSDDAVRVKGGSIHAMLVVDEETNCCCECLSFDLEAQASTYSIVDYEDGYFIPCEDCLAGGVDHIVPWDGVFGYDQTVPGVQMEANNQTEDEIEISGVVPALSIFLIYQGAASQCWELRFLCVFGEGTNDVWVGFKVSGSTFAGRYFRDRGCDTRPFVDVA